MHNFFLITTFHVHSHTCTRTQSCTHSTMQLYSHSTSGYQKSKMPYEVDVAAYILTYLEKFELQRTIETFVNESPLFRNTTHIVSRAFHSFFLFFLIYFVFFYFYCRSDRRRVWNRCWKSMRCIGRRRLK